MANGNSSFAACRAAWAPVTLFDKVALGDAITLDGPYGLALPARG
jgi:hypothetical protein